jgi:CheY-specific phosphatase CheX
MSTTIQLPKICDFLNRHLVEVFETMLSLKAVPAGKTPLPHHAEQVSGSAGFAGEDLNGALYIHMSATFANKVAAAMLGIKPEEITAENEVNDVIGEVANMLTGGLKSWLCDAGMPCAISTPVIIRGTAFAIEASPDVEREWMIFECDNERVVVEMHIKIN